MILLVNKSLIFLRNLFEIGRLQSKKLQLKLVSLVLLYSLTQSEIDFYCLASCLLRRSFCLDAILVAFRRAIRSSSEYRGLPLGLGTLHFVPNGNLVLWYYFADLVVNPWPQIVHCIILQSFVFFVVKDLIDVVSSLMVYQLRLGVVTSSTGS